MIRIIFLLVCMSFMSSVVAQRQLNVTATHNNSFTIKIEAPAGSTLYSLSKATGSDITSLRSINNKKDDVLSLYEILTLPIDQEKIVNNTAGLNSPVPLYYKVKKGDNLYRISTKVNHTAQDLILLNNKTSESLAWEEELLLGWIDWPYVGTAADPLAIVETVVETPSHTLSKPIKRKHGFLVADIRTYISAVEDRSEANAIIIPLLSEMEEKQEVFKEKGIAYWEKSKYQSKEMIVMHPHAKVDSKVSLYNPMLRRKVQAKVVSELPKEAYPEDISIVISPSVASALGALDRRFQVEITYVQ